MLILTFICLGKWLESIAKARTSSAMRKLLQLSAKTARLLTLDEDGITVIKEEEIPAELIQVRLRTAAAVCVHANS